jgi:hypothetical protein
MTHTGYFNLNLNLSLTLNLTLNLNLNLRAFPALDYIPECL